MYKVVSSAYMIWLTVQLGKSLKGHTKNACKILDYICDFQQFYNCLPILKLEFCNFFFFF